MADITLPGTGDVVATETQTGGEHVQKVTLSRSDDVDFDLTANADGLEVQLGKMIPSGTNNIGDVDVLTLPALAAGTNAIGKLAANAGVVIGDVNLNGTATLGASTTYVGKVRLTDGTNDVTLLDLTGSKVVPVAFMNSDGDQVAVVAPDDVVVQPSIDTSAYADSDNLDGTIITFAGATKTAAGTGWSAHLWVLDKEGIIGGTATPNVGLECWFLNASITPPAENAAFSLSDTDAEKVRAVVSTANGTTYDYGGGTWTTVEAGRAIPYSLASGTSLYMVAKVLDPDADGPTWTAGTSIKVGIHVMAE